MSLSKSGRPFIDPDTGVLVRYEPADPLSPPHDHVLRVEDGMNVVAVRTPQTPKVDDKPTNALGVIRRFL